jgi:hypothetical protein
MSLTATMVGHLSTLIAVGCSCGSGSIGDGSVLWFAALRPALSIALGRGPSHGSARRFAVEATECRPIDSGAAAEVKQQHRHRRRRQQWQHWQHGDRVRPAYRTSSRGRPLFLFYRTFLAI